MKQYAALDDTVYFWFAGNDTSGSGGDGASPAADVRLAGAAADAAPVYSPTPALLSHANYPAGAYEIAITASAANGFAATNTYAVFCTLAIDSQNPTGFVGSFDLKPVESNPTQLDDSAQSLTDLKDFADAGYDPATNKITGCKVNDDMVGTNGANTTTPPTVTAIREEMDTNSTKMAPSQTLADYKATSVAVSDKTGFSLSSAGIDAILDENIEGAHSFREIMRLIASAIAGKSSGGGTATITFRDIDDTKDRIVATVTTVGNRTAVTLTED